MPQRLFTPNIYCHSRSAVSREKGGRLGGERWVLARSMSLYKHIPLNNIPAKEQAQFLSLEAEQFSPFQETGRYIVIREQRAMLWVWDEAGRREEAKRLGCRREQVIPEQLLIAPAEDGLRLWQSMDGSLLELWQNGTLIADRWWDGLPEKSEVDLFCLGHDLSGQSMGQPEKCSPLERPFAPNRDSTLYPYARLEKNILTLASYIFLALFVWNGMAVYHKEEMIGRLQVAIQSKTAEAEPLLQARNDCFAQEERIISVAKKLQGVKNLQLLALISPKLPSDAILKKWRYQQGHLQITIEDDNFNPLSYIEKSQKIPGFTNIDVQQGASKERLVIQADIDMDSLPNQEGRK